MADKEIQKRSSNPILKLVNLKRFISRLRELFQPKKKSVGASWQDVKLEISDKVRRRLEMRHILENDLKQVIHHAETNGEKLYQVDSDKYLARLKIGKATFYVEYSLGAESFIVESAYAHKSDIVG